MLTIHTDSYAQAIIDAITSESRDRTFWDDRESWFDCFEDLWGALKEGAHVSVTTLGLSSVNVGYPGMMCGDLPHTEMRPTKILSSGNPRSSSLTYAIMCENHNHEDGSGPYVMVCYANRTGDEISRIRL